MSKKAPAKGSGQASLMKYMPNSNAFMVKPGMLEQFEECVYDGTIANQLLEAQTYLQGAAAIDNYMQPMGITTGVKKCREIFEQFRIVNAPTSMSISATIWMLDLSHRLISIDHLDLAHMRWAMEMVADSGSFHKVMDGFPVAAESIPDADNFSQLRKIERDADLDAVVLLVYWNRPDDESQKHPWHNHMRDLNLKVSRVGVGAEASVERFVRFDDEEKKRKAMGLSTYRRSVELKSLVDAAASARQSGEVDAALASRILSSNPQLQAWTEDTCRRYLAINDRFSMESAKVMSKWEMKYGRNCLLDSLTTMRSAATAATTKEQMTTLVHTLFWEQTCKLRSALEGRTKVGGGGNATALLRGILLRHLFFQYIAHIFPKLQDMLEVYGTWKWYQEMYGMDEHGRLNDKQTESESEQEPTDRQDGTHTRFESKRRLNILLDAMAKGKHDTAFVSMARQNGASTHLELGCDGMKSITTTVNEIYTIYKAEFPETQLQTHQLPSIDVDMNASAGEYSPARVKASNTIETQQEYHEKLSAYQDACRKAQETATKEHMDMRVVLIISDLDANKINKKLDRVSFMKEPGRKMFVYDSLIQDPLNWPKLRQWKRSFLIGAKVGMKCDQAGTMGRDTLAPLKDVYLNYRTERSPDNLSEDVVVAIVPGVTHDTPKNDYLDAAWRSLKSMGNKHVGPKIGLIVQNKHALLQQVYSRGVWARAPDHHLVFTFQTMPRNSTGRKRMKYLNEGGNFGDTAFNSWPVPLVTLANMPKTNHVMHDEIFDNDAAEDSGSNDGAGTAVVQDLGDKVIPFPRELSEMLTREMLHVFEIDVGVFLNIGSGKSLLAIIMENRRAVGIVKNKAHRDFVMQQLLEGIQTLNLAPDTRPPKPQELVAWESRAAAAKAGGATPGVPPLGGIPTATGTAGAASSPPPPPARSVPTIVPTVPPPLGATVHKPASLPPPIGSSPAGSASSANSDSSHPPPVGLAAFGAQVLR